MTERVQKILEAVGDLTFGEQTDLLTELTSRWRPLDPEASKPFQGAVSWADFAAGIPPTYRAGLDVKPVKDVSQLKMKDWPEEDSVDEMVEYIYQQRREARTP